MEKIRAAVAEIPYGQKQTNESYFQSLLLLIFRLLGKQVESEVACNTGRLDALIKTTDTIYLFEFKCGTDLDKLLDMALAQIDSKGYLIPYVATKLSLVKVAAVFDPTTRNLEKWKSVAVE
jgi:hypothetical protein